ncbi:tetratricopeptide repeat protein [Marinobacterium sp. YM272]|uniref:tetratricopeptide repeat protein n=1 Tax=Marinobacterium sp. YM272 TaxID=3421654 RepID=UPI003D7F9069
MDSKQTDAEQYCLSAGKDQTFDCNSDAPEAYTGPLRIRDLPIDDETLYARLEETKRWLAARKAELSGAAPVEEDAAPLIPEAPQAPPPNSTPEEALAAALALAQRGEYGPALSLTAQFRALTGDDLSATLVESRILFLSGDYSLARTRLEAAIDRHPGAPELYNNLATIQAAEGQTGAAISTLQKAFTTDPSFARIQANLKALYSASAQRALQPDLPAPKPTLEMIDHLP